MKFQQALDSADAGQKALAIKHLQAFVNQVMDLINTGAHSSGLGQSLVASALTSIDLLLNG